MSKPCAYCATIALMAVRIPGRDDVEAVICLACGQVQPVAVPRGRRWPSE